MPVRAETITDTATQIAPYNPRRTAIAIANDAGSKVYIAFAQTDITTRGFPLNVGEKITFSRDRNDQPELEIWAQCLAGGTADVRIYESFKQE